MKKKFVNPVSDTGLVSGIYKEPLQFSKTRNKQIFKMSKYLNRHFTKEDI